MKPVRIRPRADREIDALADYLARSNVSVALRFLGSVQEVFDLIGKQPGIGSLRYAHLPMLEGLRVCSVSGFEKHLVFFIERHSYIDVIRVLHSARDLPAALAEDE
ncbi:MAG: type II toxin-antitoxin system RelE/ParE family toxin [Alphaproteobacteria bacterium]|nr:type II toxin-antitoxin system RelE/ParE family toxin [Alphaproteobacteria bacterium]